MVDKYHKRASALQMNALRTLPVKVYRAKLPQLPTWEDEPGHAVGIDDGSLAPEELSCPKPTLLYEY